MAYLFLILQSIANCKTENLLGIVIIYFRLLAYLELLFIIINDNTWNLFEL